VSGNVPWDDCAPTNGNNLQTVARSLGLGRETAAGGRMGFEVVSVRPSEPETPLDRMCH